MIKYKLLLKRWMRILLFMLFLFIFSFQWNIWQDTRISQHHIISAKSSSINVSKTWISSVKRQKDSRNRSYILVWRRPWGNLKEGWKEGMDLGKCVVTYQRARLKDAAAVVFHYTALDIELMPWKYYRDPDQIFIFFSMESPSYILNLEKKSLHKFHKFVNWTMTHRRDSDVFFSYVTSQSIDALLAQRNQLDKILSKKENVAIWVVSNCNVLRGSRIRMKYSKELLQAGLPLHRFGRCFHNSDKYALMSDEQLKSYKFYLAFENSQYCKDYVTEKFWTQGILQWRVPVVFGASKKDVSEIAPPQSFIHVDDFSSAKDLASYLMYLHSNPAAYRKYFAWIEKPDLKTKKFLQMYKLTRHERLCAMVTSPQKEHKQVDDVANFLYRTENNVCLQEIR